MSVLSENPQSEVAILIRTPQLFLPPIGLHNFCLDKIYLLAFLFNLPIVKAFKQWSNRLQWYCNIKICFNKSSLDVFAIKVDGGHSEEVIQSIPSSPIGVRFVVKKAPLATLSTWKSQRHPIEWALRSPCLCSTILFATIVLNSAIPRPSADGCRQNCSDQWL